MRSKLTSLLLICLTLMLPLRAVAGMAMFGCSPNHHASSIVSLNHSVTVSAHDMSGCHESKGVPSQAQDNCQHGHGSAENHAAGTCSACGDCCVGALTIPFIQQTTLSHETSSSLINFYDHPYTGFHPEGLERPPRNALS